DAVAARNALRAQRVPHAIRECHEFTVSYFPRFANDGGAFRAQRGRRIQKMRRQIEMLRQFPVHRSFGGSHAEPSVHTDIFVPNLGVVSDVLREHLDAFARTGVEDLRAVFAEPVNSAREIHGFADDYRADAELAYQAAAIPAGSQRGYHDFVAVAALPACFAKSICFAVGGRIAFLDSAVVAAS